NILICRVRCTRINACGVLYQTRVASAKSDTLKQEINKTLEFYKVLATEKLISISRCTMAVRQIEE
ncbi:hypothetical protein, partial [Aliibacillus thermotolerans]|uniref:hypothetical protein n=1 Tax=Aliibacillus thermotolerans TaxID=1834418 RepID=UPI0022EB4597